jgi:hypothetical protein
MAGQGGLQQPDTLQRIASGNLCYDQHRRLNPSEQEIRLLDLEDAGTCTMRHVSLLKTSDFYAVSYYWGPSTSTKTLKIKQVGPYQVQSVSIRRTLADFLEHLYGNYGRISIWLDVICINQEYLPEKNKQVAMMGLIYKRARGVFAWMGSWDPDIEYLANHSKRTPVGFASSGLDCDRASAALQVLFQRPYWTR